MNVDFSGFGEKVITFSADNTVVKPGVPVRMADNGMVTRCTSNENFCGVCVGLRDGYAAVQVAGYIRMPANTKITVGFRKLAAGSKDDIAANSAGRELLVVESSATEVGFIL